MSAVLLTLTCTVLFFDPTGKMTKMAHFHSKGYSWRVYHNTSTIIITSIDDNYQLQTSLNNCAATERRMRR
jgi:hypothetical protein